MGDYLLFKERFCKTKNDSDEALTQSLSFLYSELLEIAPLDKSMEGIRFIQYSAAGHRK